MLIEPSSRFGFKVIVCHVSLSLFFVVNISTGLTDAVLTVALSVYVIRQFNTTTAPKQQRNDTEFEPPECRVWPWIRDKRSSFYVPVAYHQTFNPDYAKNRGPATGTKM